MNGMVMAIMAITYPVITLITYVAQVLEGRFASFKNLRVMLIGPSLIAIMLSRLRMTVDDCIKEYEDLAGSVFGNARIFHQTFLPTVWLKRPKYDAATLETVITGVLRRRGEICPDLDGSLFKTGRDMCRT